MIEKMNEGITYDDALQNRFSAYLLTAVNRRKIAYLEKKSRQEKNDRSLFYIEHEKIDIEAEGVKKLPLHMQIENDLLFDALMQLSEQEKYVFLQRTVAMASFEGLAQELKLSYKGVATIYYRAMQKVRDYMRRMRNDI